MVFEAGGLGSGQLEAAAHQIVHEPPTVGLTKCQAAS